MKQETWQPLYEQICKDFGFDPSEDLRNAQRLASMLGGRGASALESVWRSFPRSVLICGSGDALAEQLSSMKIERYVVVADAATSVVADAGISIDMIVTDLDGLVEDQIEVNSAGAVAFVHAHGDNGLALDRYFGRFVGPVVGTCQCPPPRGVFNFGGFTDGDRAACICAELGARSIMLAGFDFENPSPKASKSREVKRNKLRWAKVILEVLERQGVRFEYADR